MLTYLITVLVHDVFVRVVKIHTYYKVLYTCYHAITVYANNDDGINT